MARTTTPTGSAIAKPDSEVAPDHPNVVALPPLVYAAGLVIGFLFELALPLVDLPSAVSWFAGSIVVAGGVALGIWFLASFRRAQTPVDISKPTRTIVTTGPYRFTRNPGYVSLAAIYVGIALLGDALWPLLLLPAILLIIHRGVILREEGYLERKFGEEYLRYKGATRRWL